MDDLKREIIKTLIFYDIFEFPLTPLEIYKNLSRQSGLKDILAAVEELERENQIIKKDGYFFLPQEKNLTEQRCARFLISFWKLERAKKMAGIFAYFPFIKFIGICNSLGYFNAAKESDIDFFIIVRRGHLWTARFLCAALCQIFNLRPQKDSAKDKFCLSFFISDNNLDIKNIALLGGDPYLEHWLGWIMPLYDDGIYKKFICANSWIKNYLPNFLEHDSLKISHQSLIKKIAEKIFAPAEKYLRALQFRLMPKELKKAASREDRSVVVSDATLKFHLIDRREEYREKFRARIETLLLNNDQFPNDQ